MQLASLDLNLLVALDALLDEQSVTRAAERLHVGQSAMSATLARIRSIFDDPLLVRDGRSLKATPFGESLREPLAAVLREIQALVDRASLFDPEQSDRIFTVIASDYVALVLLRPLLERLAKEAPQIQIRVRPIEAGLLDDLGRGLVDLVIYPRELLPRNRPFSSQPLFEDRYVCVVDAAHPDVTDQLTQEQFASLPYLAASQGVLRSLADDHLDGDGLARNTMMVAQSFVMAPFLLPGTRMYTLIHQRLADILMADLRFKVLPPPYEIPPIHELMLWSPRDNADPGHAWLRHQLAGLAAEL
ncbi:LysR family transcriptional regulator [Georgenia sp. AZ-5]|uniref:LysR family transcriptional regulator n=1 Tax=Georgenia sp. AZ-5 TaxID=3367526 RepID=UPI003754B94A